MKISKKSSKAVVNDGSHPKESASESSTRKKLFMILLQEYLLLPQDQGGMVLTLHLLNSQSSYLEISEVSVKVHRSSFLYAFFHAYLKT